MKISGKMTIEDQNSKLSRYSGISKIDDVLDAKSVTAEGIIDFDKMQADDINLRGELSFDSIQTQLMKLVGTVKFKNIVGKDIRLRGTFHGDSINADSIRIDGALNVDDITGDDVQIIFSSKNEIQKIISNVALKIFPTETESKKEIVAGLLSSLLSRSVHVKSEQPTIFIGNIEADTVELSHCNCKTIRCKKAILRDGCKIDDLHCESVDADESVKILNRD